MDSTSWECIPPRKVFACACEDEDCDLHLMNPAAFRKLRWLRNTLQDCRYCGLFALVSQVMPYPTPFGD